MVRALVEDGIDIRIAHVERGITNGWRWQVGPRAGAAPGRRAAANMNLSSVTPVLRSPGRQQKPGNARCP